MKQVTLGSEAPGSIGKFDTIMKTAALSWPDQECTSIPTIVSMQ